MPAGLRPAEAGSRCVSLILLVTQRHDPAGFVARQSSDRCPSARLGADCCQWLPRCRSGSDAAAKRPDQLAPWKGDRLSYTCDLSGDGEQPSSSKPITSPEPGIACPAASPAATPAHREDCGGWRYASLPGGQLQKIGSLPGTVHPVAAARPRTLLTRPS